MNTASSHDVPTIAFNVTIISFPQNGGPLGPKDYAITVASISGGFKFNPTSEGTQLTMYSNPAGKILQPPANTKFVFTFTLVTSGFSFVSPGIDGSKRNGLGSEPIKWDRPSSTATIASQTGKVTDQLVNTGKTDYGYTLIIQQNGGPTGVIDPDVEFDVTDGTVHR